VNIYKERGSWFIVDVSGTVAGPLGESPTIRGTVKNGNELRYVEWRSGYQSVPICWLPDDSGVIHEKMLQWGPR